MYNSPTSGAHWRHYKSDATEFHTYTVVDIAVHSETHGPMDVYHPLYGAPTESWVHGYNIITRPLSYWHGIVKYNLKDIQRFIEISK